MNKNKFYSFIKVSVLLISLFFLFENSKENYKTVLIKINFDIQIIFSSILLVIIIQNLLNIRSFYFLNLTSKYNANFSEWSSLFYLTGLINHSPFWGAGHILRSYEMKKNNYSHKEYVNMYIFIFFWGTLVYSSLLILPSFFLIEFNSYISTILLILFILSLIVTSKITLKYCVKILNHLNLFKFIKNNKFSNYLSKELLKMAKLSALVSNKKVFFNFFFFTLLLICFEYSLFNLIFKFLFEAIDPSVIFLFFLSNFLIRMVKPIDNIIGFKETILGLYGQQLGLLFLEGALIVMIWRLLGLISLIINYIIYYVINKFSY
jgi:hypothetical protein